MTTTTAHAAPPIACAVNRLVPFVHVVDVDLSIGFYATLGFSPRNVMKEACGRAFWARLQSGAGEIMLARADGPVDAGQQAVLFYMYSEDVAALRRHLLASGLRDAGVYSGAASPEHGPRSVFHISRPHHMPAGEMRIADPDGYVILVGQLG